MNKRILSLLLAFVMVFSLAGIAFAAPVESYTDLDKNAWYYGYVTDVVTEGYYIGYSDTEFGPEDHMTRAQMVTVLARLAGVTVDGEGVNNVDAGFEDVAVGAWYAAAVKWAHDTGITTGVTPTEFWPNVDVTREDACTFIIRFLGFMAERDDVTFDHLKNEDLIFEFADEEKIRDYSAAAVDECMAYGLVWGDTGDETGTFRPQDAWKRCEGAKMISILADILENGKSNYVPPYTPPSPPAPGQVTYSYSLVYHISLDGATWTEWTGKTQTGTKTVSEYAPAPSYDFTITSDIPTTGFTVGEYTYNFVGWTRINDGTADDDCAAGQTVTVDANSSVVLYAVYEKVSVAPVPATFELVYSVDGKTDVIAGERVEEVATEHAFTVTDVALYDNGTVEYAIIGWDTDAAADTVVYEAGASVTVAANSTVTLYAVLVPTDDYIKLAVLGAIEDANEYIAKAEDLTVEVGSHDVTVGNFVAAEDVTLSGNTVKVAVTGELNSSTVANVIAIATEYAVGILGPEELPTKDEIKDVVKDTAASVGVTLEGQTVEEIAKQVYDKVYNAGVNVFSNFRNYEGGYCITKISVMSGEEAVVSIGVSNDKGLTTDGADASKAAAKKLAKALAKALYADLKAQSGSAVTLNAAIDVDFEAAYVSTYNDTYTLDLALTLKSDMYVFDGATNTLYLVITDELQEQYEASVEELMTAALENGTVQAKLTTLVKSMVEKSGLLDSLSSLAAKDAVDAAIDLWIAANLKAEADGDIDTPYEFLWTKEGTIVDNGDGTYSTSTGTVLGDNAALYAVVETVYADVLTNMINEKVTAKMLADALGVAKAEVETEVETALAAWKTANTNKLDANSLYSFLYNGGEIKLEGEVYTPAKVGVNDALYELIETVYSKKLTDVINGVDSSMVSGGLLDSIKDILDPAEVDAAVAAALTEWKTANVKNEEGSLYYFLFNGGKITLTDGVYDPATVGVNDALVEMIIDLCEGEDGLAETVAETALDEAEKQAGAALWANLEDLIKLGLVAGGVKTELQDAGITGDFYNYIVNICLAEAAESLGLTDKQAEYVAAADSSCVAPMVNEMLVKGIYNATKGNEYVGLDKAGRAALVDEMLVEKLYEATKGNDYVGLDKADREDLVDQLILEALATATVKGKTLGEYLNHAWNVKSIERMADYELGLFISLLDNATFQNAAAEYGNDYVSYLAKAIAKLPENASVTVEGVVISKTALNAVKAAAEKNDAAAVCAALADYLAPLSDITLGSLEADPLTITVQYGSRSATVNFGVIIE